jgi:hypothetical protein
MNLDLITAVLLALGGFSIGMRQIVLSPRNATYPPAPSFVRFAMFVFAAMLAGSAVLFFGEQEVAGAYAGKAGWLVVVLAAAAAAYNATMLVNILGQRYPAEVWRRMNRAAATVKRSCPERKFSVPAPLHVPARR